MSLLKVNEVTDLAGVIPDGVGRIVQVVKATDTSRVSTTSTSFVDTFSLSITPTSSSSQIILIASLYAGLTIATSNPQSGRWQITDSANNAVQGAADGVFGFFNNTADAAYFSDNRLILLGSDSPATTSATTYKIRQRSSSTSVTAVTYSDRDTSLFFALEVAA